MSAPLHWENSKLMLTDDVTWKQKFSVWSLMVKGLRTPRIETEMVSHEVVKAGVLVTS